MMVIPDLALSTTCSTNDDCVSVTAANSPRLRILTRSLPLWYSLSSLLSSFVLMGCSWDEWWLENSYRGRGEQRRSLTESIFFERALWKVSVEFPSSPLGLKRAPRVKRWSHDIYVWILQIHQHQIHYIRFKDSVANSYILYLNQSIFGMHLATNLGLNQVADGLGRMAYMPSNRVNYTEYNILIL